LDKPACRLTTDQKVPLNPRTPSRELSQPAEPAFGTLTQTRS